MRCRTQAKARLVADHLRRCPSLFNETAGSQARRDPSRRSDASRAEESALERSRAIASTREPHLMPARREVQFPARLIEPTFIARSQAMADTWSWRPSSPDCTCLCSWRGNRDRASITWRSSSTSARPARMARSYIYMARPCTTGSLGSDLYGHAQGAFTGASRTRTGLITSADGGILFPDEVGNIKSHEQGNLLHVREARPYCALGEDRPRMRTCALLARLRRSWSDSSNEATSFPISTSASRAFALLCRRCVAA